MKRVAAAIAAVALAGCLPDDEEGAKRPGDGGAVSGGATSSGGTSSGGTSSDGGRAGGTTSSGGIAVASGGVTSSGGTPASNGGTPSAGGASVASGGSTSSGGASSGGASSAGGAAPGSGGSTSVPPGKVPVFVAVGHMGRTTVSCDDGRSWIHDQSLNDGARCFEGGLDCDHTNGAGRGLAYGEGYFVASFGWGQPGRLRRSKDGRNWETAKDGTIFAGVAYGNGVFVANAHRPVISGDALSWHDAEGQLGLNVGNTRGIDWFSPGGGRFLVTGESETTDIVQSKDDGETWQHVGTPPKDCGVWTRGAAHNDTTVVLGAGKGWVCRSTNGGDTWEVVKLDADNLSGPVIWTGTEFITWNRADVHRSKDGKTWTKEMAQPGNISIGPVARSPDGTFVAANDGWMVWYDKQQFFRSADGVNWELLDKSRFKGSHPINFIRFGYADEATLGCP